MTRRRTFYHPASGLAILAIDWLFFGLDWELGPLSLAVSCLLAAGLCYAVVRRVQEKWHGDEPRLARAKALVGAAAAGVPFAVGGTVLGGLILALSGLDRVRALVRRP
ncbi:MAG: phosphoribosylaminoimidazole carboxylase [Elusimicrobia bacterium]|nr:phosphoribosylaminoimidazole carboxylase [Elusimicrobiota bacterium]